MEKGLTNHQSTVFLFDPDTGRLAALVGGNYLTAVRTAASSAVSIAHLAREDVKVLGMVGAGHQAGFQLRAAADQRNFEKVIGWNRSPEAAPIWRSSPGSRPAVRGRRTRRALRPGRCDHPSSSALRTAAESDWIKPGTHIACMGTDTKGKQEVSANSWPHATVFTDEIAQSVSIGEAQHAIAAGLITESDITPIGDVINGTHPGRTSEDEITLFDGTGVGLQDLAVATVAAKLAKEKGLAQEVSL